MELNLEFVADRRAKLNIPMQEMAAKLGFKNASTYLKYERGNYRFRADQLPDLADALRCTIEDFFTQNVAKSTKKDKEKEVI